jgi:hypothetical protein
MISSSQLAQSNVMGNSEALEQAIIQAEAALKQAEERFGPDHMAVAYELEKCAQLLRRKPDGLLTAVNMQARAQIIRDTRPHIFPASRKVVPGTPMGTADFAA